MNKSATPVQPLITVEELSELLRKKPRTVREMVYKGQIPYLKIGRSIRFDPNVIQDWIRDNSHPPPDNNVAA